jgi:hypothetical protein
MRERACSRKPSRSFNGQSASPEALPESWANWAAYTRSRARGLSLVRLKELSKQRYVAPIDIAVVYEGLKDVDRTFKYLELAYEDHCYGMLAVKISRFFDFLRNDPRYHDLLRRMHLEP